MSEKDNQGAIWKNKKREKDTHPHYTGNATVDGVEYWVSAWKKSDDASENAPLVKFSFKPKEEAKPQREEPRRKPESPPFEDDSDLPF